MGKKIEILANCQKRAKNIVKSAWEDVGFTMPYTFYTHICDRDAKSMNTGIPS